MLTPATASLVALVQDPLQPQGIDAIFVVNMQQKVTGTVSCAVIEQSFVVVIVTWQYCAGIRVSP